MQLSDTCNSTITRWVRFSFHSLYYITVFTQFLPHIICPLLCRLCVINTSKYEIQLMLQFLASNTPTITSNKHALYGVGIKEAMNLKSFTCIAFLCYWIPAFSRHLRWPNTVFKCLCLIHHNFLTIYALVPIFCKSQG